jgi:hypothetical protein
MKLLKFLGIAWGIAYFVVGVLSSFTINSIDTYSSIALLTLTFLLPLPLTVIGVWFPKTTGVALILCVMVSGAIFLFLYGAKDTATAYSKGFYIPHMVFGVAYLLAGRGTSSIDLGLRRLLHP